VPQTVTLQIVDNGLLRAGNPETWRGFRTQLLREVTLGALTTIQEHASKLWKYPTGGGLDQSWMTRIDEDAGAGYVWNAKRYAYWLNYGVRPQKMRWLLLNSRNAFYLADGTRAAIVKLVLRDEGNKTIFRMITEKHLQYEVDDEGKRKWWHPGLEPKHFLERGMQHYAEFKLRRDYNGLIVRVLKEGRL
jgi:hypothetical protein